MSIGNEIDRLKSAKTALRAAIEAKGVSVPESSTIDSYTEYVAAIPNGVTSVNGQTGDVEVKAVLYEQQTLTKKQQARARSNIDAAQKEWVAEFTLLASGWTGDSAPYSYTLAVTGVTATSNQEWLPALDITTEQLAALQAANIQDGGQAAGSVTLKAFGEDKPTIDLPIRIILRGD